MTGFRTMQIFNEFKINASKKGNVYPEHDVNNNAVNVFTDVFRCGKNIKPSMNTCKGISS